MQMNNGAHLGQRCFRAVQVVIDGKKVTLRKFVGPFDNHCSAALRFDGRPGKAAFKSPHAGGRQIAVNLLLSLA